MSDERGKASGRVRKAVDYSKLASFGDSDDDDFLQPSKRPKQKSESQVKSKKPEKKHKTESSTELIPLDQRKERKSVSDKVFDRRVQEALLLSATVNLGEKCATVDLHETKEKHNETGDGLCTVISTDSEDTYEPKDEAEIIVIEPDEPKRDPEQFLGGKVSEVSNNVEIRQKTKKKPDVAFKKQETKAVPTTRVRNETKIVPPKRPLSENGCNITIPSTKIKIPNTGLRLGLSRNVPAKPLHSFVKAQH